MKQLITKNTLKQILMCLVTLLLILNIIKIIYPNLYNNIFKKHFTIESFKNKKKNNKVRIKKFWNKVLSDTE